MRKACLAKLASIESLLSSTGTHSYVIIDIVFTIKTLHCN